MFRSRSIYLLALLPTLTELAEVGRFPTSLRELITDVVLTVAIVVLIRRLHREYRQVVKLSETDPLTGLGNRRKLWEDLGQEVSRARSYGTPLTLAFFDLDRFKSVNDRFGHTRGDELLTHLGRLLRQATRSCGDRWYRFGGDEFVVLLPGTESRGAGEVLVRIEGLITDLLQPYGAGLSTGLTELEAEDTASDLLRRADRLLYAHKGVRVESVARAAVHLTLHANEGR